jgi:predicted hydrocarbon binding protein
MPPRPTNHGRRQTREEFFQPHPAEGALRQPDGQRAALVPLEFLADLSTALTQEFGDRAHHLLYCTGFDWSLRDMVRLGQRLRTGSGSQRDLDLWQMDVTFVLESWWAPLAAAGWGECSFSNLPHGLLLAEVRASAPALAASRVTAPACHLSAGLLAGALSFYARAERHAVEVQCAALGHPTCQFIAGASTHTDAVEKWRQQNVSADEIRQRLASLPDAAT